MEGTTLDGEKGGGPEPPPSSRADELGAWFYTGPAGRLLSFSIDLALSLAALGAWSAKRAWQRISSSP
jgi:hypothetical protein